MPFIAYCRQQANRAPGGTLNSATGAPEGPRWHYFSKVPPGPRFAKSVDGGERSIFIGAPVALFSEPKLNPHRRHFLGRSFYRAPGGTFWSFGEKCHRGPDSRNSSTGCHMAPGGTFMIVPPGARFEKKCHRDPDGHPVALSARLGVGVGGRSPGPRWNYFSALSVCMVANWAPGRTFFK